MATALLNTVFSYVTLFVKHTIIGDSFRITSVVGFSFLAQNFGKGVGTCEYCLLFCECRWGGGSIWRQL